MLPRAIGGHCDHGLHGALVTLATIGTIRVRMAFGGTLWRRWQLVTIVTKERFKRGSRVAVGIAPWKARNEASWTGVWACPSSGFQGLE